MAKKRGAPKKTPTEIKSAVTQIRLLAEEKAGFEDAAKFSGLSLSAWMRQRLRTAARNELEELGQVPPFLPPLKKTRK